MPYSARKIIIRSNHWLRTSSFSINLGSKQHFWWFIFSIYFVIIIYVYNKMGNNIYIHMTWSLTPCVFAYTKWYLCMFNLFFIHYLSLSLSLFTLKHIKHLLKHTLDHQINLSFLSMHPVPISIPSVLPSSFNSRHIQLIFH